MDGEILKFFCRHLVSLGWYEGPIDEHGEFTDSPQFFGASGFMLQLHDSLPYYLITAGHVFTENIKRLSSSKSGAKNHGLFDIWWGDSNCNQPIPFNFFDTPSYVTFDKEKGIDTAVIPLPHHVQKAISQTTVPFTKESWINQSDVLFDSYAMLGTPIEDADSFKDINNDIELTTTFLCPVLLPLELCDLPPDIAATSNPQFVAKIDPAVDLNSIVGMSGGPILGFRTNKNGQQEYWPVAIQSRWLPHKRITIGTSIPLVTSIIQDQIEATMRESSS